MIFAWLKRRRRKKLLRTPPSPEWDRCLKRFDFVRHLEEPQHRRLLELARVFEAEKHWEGCAGLEVTEEMRVVVSTLACRLILALDHRYYQRVSSILIYPASYRRPKRAAGAGGVMSEGTAHNAGESWSNGPIVLSWNDTVRGFRDPDDGHDLVLHEFAHKLDTLDGYADGAPAGNARANAWRHLVGPAYEEHRERCERRKRTFLDPYGATNPAEFFAVSTEAFFERGREMRRRHEDLYSALATFYGQDPAANG